MPGKPRRRRVSEVRLRKSCLTTGAVHIVSHPKTEQRESRGTRIGYTRLVAAGTGFSLIKLEQGLATGDPAAIVAPPLAVPALTVRVGLGAIGLFLDL
jgi:hypothetical protein